MFETTIAGSLPKPSWLAEPNKLWPQWRLAGDELAAAKADATVLALKESTGRHFPNRVTTGWISYPNLSCKRFYSQ